MGSWMKNNYAQSCVKTLMLSSENHPQNVPISTPKHALWRNISASHSGNLTGMFTRLCSRSIFSSGLSGLNFARTCLGFQEKVLHMHYGHSSLQLGLGSFKQSSRWVIGYQSSKKRSLPSNTSKAMSIFYSSKFGETLNKYDTAIDYNQNLTSITQ